MGSSNSRTCILGRLAALPDSGDAGDATDQPPRPSPTPRLARRPGGRGSREWSRHPGEHGPPHRAGHHGQVRQHGREVGRTNQMAGCQRSIFQGHRGRARQPDHRRDSLPRARRMQRRPAQQWAAVRLRARQSFVTLGKPPPARDRRRAAPRLVTLFRRPTSTSRRRATTGFWMVTFG